MRTRARRRSDLASWCGVLAVVAIAATWSVSACGNADAPSDDPAAAPPARAGSTSGGSSSGASSSSGQSASGGSSGNAADAGSTSSGGTTSATEPNLKVAFIGDTAARQNFRNVLRLVRAENAQLLLIQGDLTYSGEDANDWFPVIDAEINKAQPGSSAPVTIPYFVSKGNHDQDWASLAGGLKDRMAKWSVLPEHNDPTKINHAIVYKGLKIVMVGDEETSNPTRAEYITQRLQGDKHIWKICSWHKNQRATNVGPKDDDMGWAVYESCRTHGAIVAQGHSHTYSRSKTMTNDTMQVVDATCADPFALCVGPGKHFFFDSSLGGVDTRPLNTTIAARPYWASTYTGSYGALFIEFYVDGDPKKARGYFKNVGGTRIDPPPSSGKAFFTITASP